jgi:hypothetical protein
VYRDWLKIYIISPQIISVKEEEEKELKKKKEE